jgi:hypothetical protein
MLEYARIFAYRTDMNLIGRDGRTDRQDGRTDVQTTLLTNVYNEIVLLGLLICDYRSYNVLMCTGWLPLAAYQRT